MDAMLKKHGRSPRKVENEPGEERSADSGTPSPPIPAQPSKNGVEDVARKADNGKKKDDSGTSKDERSESRLPGVLRALIKLASASGALDKEQTETALAFVEFVCEGLARLGNSSRSLEERKELLRRFESYRNVLRAMLSAGVLKAREHFCDLEHVAKMTESVLSANWVRDVEENQMRMGTTVWSKFTWNASVKLWCVWTSPRWALSASATANKPETELIWDQQRPVALQ